MEGLTAESVKGEDYKKTVRNYQCDVCLKAFTSAKLLNQHWKVHAKLECIVKTKPFSPKDYMIGGNTLYESEKHLLCELCGKSYTRINSFMRHKLTHDIDDKPSRTCRICNKIFSNIYNYQTHCDAIHQSREKYKCGLCTKTFAVEMYLKRHMKIHQNREPGGKTHATEVSFNDDMFFHEGSGPGTFNCYVCDKPFPQRDILDAHINTHNKEPVKPHKCPECGKGFAFKSYLDRHVKTHSKSARGTTTKQRKTVDDTNQRVVILFDENGREVDEKLYLIDEKFDLFDRESSFFEEKSGLFIKDHQIVVKTEEDSSD